MNVLFIMDPLEKIHPSRDTTYLLIREALKRKMKVFYGNQRQLSFRQGQVCSEMAEIKALESIEKEGIEQSVFTLSAFADHPLSFFQIVFMRKDPPFDLHYLTACYLLDLADSEVLMINRPKSLTLANEKLYALQWPHLCPETLVSSESKKIRNFLREQGGTAVLKPIYRCGGEGVFLLQEKDPNLNSILEASLTAYPEGVVVQRYIPEVRKGDKRIIVIDGDPLGAVLRVSPTVDVRSNIHVGGECFKVELTQRDQEICAELKPKLKEMGLFLVGLDVIGEYLTEINVTSPTGYQEINRLNQLTGDKALESLTFDRVLKK